jgi:2-hydroxy-3-oxopropionate reductase
VKAGLIGLGAMGLPMGRSLLAAGHELVAWNRSTGRLDDLAASGAIRAATPRVVAEQADVVLTMLPDLPQVEAICAGPTGLLAGSTEGRVLVVMGTVSPVAVTAFGERLNQRGIQVVDAPVSGGVEAATAGTLSIMVGGDAEPVSQVWPLFEAMGATVRHLGPLGAGSLAKACNQMIVAATLTTLSEALVLAERAGLDLPALLDLLAGGLAGSRVLETKREKLLNRDYRVTGAARFLYKDLGFALAAARDTATVTPMAALCDQLYASIVGTGMGDEDNCVIHQLITRLSGAES